MATRTVRTGFGGVLPDHKRIVPADPLDREDVEREQKERWLRAIQKKELAAYLKGHKRFTHGRDEFRNPLRYNVRELTKQVPL
jgi:hypothetical protein